MNTSTENDIEYIYNEIKRNPKTRIYKKTQRKSDSEKLGDENIIEKDNYNNSNYSSIIKDDYDYSNSNHSNHTFSSMITPVNNLVTSHNTNSVRFYMKRKNCIITLQWENFSGIVASTGDSKLVFVQSISSLPNSIMSFPILVKHNGTKKMGEFIIDPFSSNGNLYIYLTLDGAATQIGDSFYIYSSSISWIVV